MAMHDWSFVSATLVWQKAELTLVLIPVRHGADLPGSDQVMLSAQGVALFHCPKKEEWGTSTSILEASLEDLETGRKLSIVMQTGDTIEVIAESFVLPPGTNL